MLCDSLSRRGRVAELCSGNQTNNKACFSFIEEIRDLSTPGSMNSLFSDLFRGILEGYFRGCSGLFRGGFGRFLVVKTKRNKRKQLGKL